MVNAQDYINEKYKDKTVKILHICEENLEGELNLSEFVDLVDLDCSGNQLTILDLCGNTKLREIDCSCNHLQLIKINLPDNYDESSLEYLNLLNNRFPEQDLSFFREFVNLKKLFIGNDNDIDDEQIRQNFYNQFHGDLGFLKDLKNLELLDIKNTNIVGGLEYLPDSVKTLRCSCKRLKTDFEVKKIYKQLEAFAIDDKDAFTGRYNLRGWKENWKLNKENESLQELKKENESLKEQIDELNRELMSNENEELNIQLAELKEREKVLLAAQKDLKTEIENLKQQKNHLESELKKATDIYQQAKKELGEKEKVLETLTITNEPTQQILQLQNDIKDLSYTLSAKKKAEEFHREKLEAVDRKLKDREEKIKSLEAQLTGVYSSINEIHTKQKELGRMKEDLAKELSYGKGSTSTLRKRMDSLREQIKSKTKERDLQMNEAKQVLEELEEVRKSGKILQEEKNQLQVFINKVKGDKQNVEEKLDFVHQEIKRQIAALTSQIQIKEEKLREFTDNIRNNYSIREKTLREILAKQKEFIENDSSISDDLEKKRQKLVSEGLDNEKVDKLLNMQEEVIRLKMLQKQLESFLLIQEQN